MKLSRPSQDAFDLLALREQMAELQAKEGTLIERLRRTHTNAFIARGDKFDILVEPTSGNVKTTKIEVVS